MDTRELTLLSARPSEGEDAVIEGVRFTRESSPSHTMPSLWLMSRTWVKRSRSGEYSRPWTYFVSFTKIYFSFSGI